MTQKFIDRDGLKVLWNQVNLKDYPNNETLMAVIDAIDETKANKDELSGTVEITSGNPEKENTVLTINPGADEVNVYTVEEVDEMIASIDGGVFSGDASSIPYDDTETQFGINNVQDAIGQIIENLKSLSLSYNNNILYLSLNGVVISSCTIVPTVVGSISLDNIISIDNLQSGVYTLKYENDESILDGVENICELEVF